MTTTDKSKLLADFLAKKGAVRCPPGVANATSLARMRREHEHALVDVLVDGGLERESERAREAFGAARANGHSVSDALDYGRDAANRRR